MKGFNMIPAKVSIVVLWGDLEWKDCRVAMIITMALYSRLKDPRHFFPFPKEGEKK